MLSHFSSETISWSSKLYFNDKIREIETSEIAHFLWIFTTIVTHTVLLYAQALHVKFGQELGAP